MQKDYSIRNVEGSNQNASKEEIITVFIVAETCART